MVLASNFYDFSTLFDTYIFGCDEVGQRDGVGQGPRSVWSRRKMIEKGLDEALHNKDDLLVVEQGARNTRLRFWVLGGLSLGPSLRWNCTVH